MRLGPRDRRLRHCLALLQEGFMIVTPKMLQLLQFARGLLLAIVTDSQSFNMFRPSQHIHAKRFIPLSEHGPSHKKHG